MDTILEVNNLSKQFYKNKKLFTAVNGISFTLQRGECLGIVGEREKAVAEKALL